MRIEEQQAMEAASERARAAVLAGQVPDQHDEPDAESHASSDPHREPVEIDPQTEAILRERLTWGDRVEGHASRWHTRRQGR